MSSTILSVKSLFTSRVIAVGSAFKQQVRSVSMLGKLSDNHNAQTNPKRVGRGASSGYGKTSGKGQKGQKARGKSKSWFEGGQTPIYKLFPKRGFKHDFDDLESLNLSKLQHWIDMGRINPAEEITMKVMRDSGVITSIKNGVKILGGSADKLKQPLTIISTSASASAIQNIETMGGQFTAKYYNKLSLFAHLNPQRTIERFGRIPIEAAPIRRKYIEFYQNEAKRGYLTNQPTFALPPKVKEQDKESDQLHDMLKTAGSDFKAADGWLESTIVRQLKA
ncbi:ribosomal protein L15 [Nadsonia fulvescens var. elongata DSM 6958]|uniref:Ribosomal protein L15 n=1 Tax=Nadsonia fulvescens var. elongata DSM 6958 TaxID=857566 RepID=A0A1E3PGH4_9ASCO|nr:ribosomal protein L15 [Nadsonia fulvescens var. elongata DSM 6958]